MEVFYTARLSSGFTCPLRSQNTQPDPGPYFLKIQIPNAQDAANLKLLENKGVVTQIGVLIS